MSIHDEKPVGERKVPWEPLDQIKPEDLPDFNPDPERFPTPWGLYGRGNGHIDVMADNGTYVAHVYTWDLADSEILKSKLKAVNGE